MLRFSKNNFESSAKDVVHNNNKKTDKSRNTLPKKQFKNRRSLLIELFEDNIHIRVVYNIFVTFFIFFVLTFLFKEFLQGRVPAAFKLIYKLFGKLHRALLFWLGNNISTIAVYYGFLLWGLIRRKVNNKEIWDIFGIVLLVTYYILSFYTVTIFINKFDISFASAMIVSMESVRFLMKIHAFVRSNFSKLLEINHEGKNPQQSPPLSKFLYFLYAPTAVYRDEYPRTTSIRWDFVFYRALEILAVIIFYAFCFEYVGRPIFQNTCSTKMTLLDLIVLLVEFAVPSILILWGIFFVLLHSTQNLFAELLRFGDRLFYTDWWTCTDIQQYYKKWNVVIGDWLYTYVHKDICESFSLKESHRNLVKIATILLSAFAHEWICTVSSGYFLPVLTYSMTLSAIMCVTIKVKSKGSLSSIIALSCMIFGSSIIASAYGLEYFGRTNMKLEKNFVSVFLTQGCVNVDFSGEINYIKS